MSRTKNWHTRAIYLMMALAFVLGLAIMPATLGAQEVLPSLVPNIDFDAKGSVHKVCINPGTWNLTGATIDWWLSSGVELTPDDITVIAPDPDPGVKVIGTSDNVTCIEIQSYKRGDIHINVDITRADGTRLEQPLQAEKKWGELYRTELDVNPNKDGVQHTEIDTEKVEFPAGAIGIYEEVIKDTVYATFLEVPEPQLVDDAIVHWWLVWDTEANQAWVDALMDYLATPTNNGTLDDNHWAAHGKYNINELGEPWKYINDWVCGIDEIAGTADDRAVDPNLFRWDGVDVPGEIDTAPNTDAWYAWAKTDNGIASANLSVNVTGLKACETYGVMIVVLVSYPGGSNAQDDPYNGENIICVEKGKKQFHKGEIPLISEVKTPQLRWAGEKIVLEKDWGVGASYTEDYTDLGDGYWTNDIRLNLYAAIYNLEEGSVGNLEPIDDAAGIIVSTPSNGTLYIDLEYLGLPAGAQQVICPLGGWYYNFSNATDNVEDWAGYSDSQCILSTQQSGEADVNAALYEIAVIIHQEGAPGGLTLQTMEADFNGPVRNYGFLVYFLEFEDITLAEDITPSLEGIEAGTDAPVAFQVRGFFDYNHSHLMATTREAKPIDLDGDGVADKILPAGRYILPDDWWLIAETKNVALRPNFDLMDRANLDDIVSNTTELGPFSPVRTIEALDGMAEYPTIGPFSTYQLWSTDDMWVTAATVPSSYWWVPYLYLGDRNTVVPDGNIDKWDAPMPQALVIFNVVSDIGTLSGLNKGDLEGYGFEWSGSNKIYQSPYYAVEIPANWQIPLGYNWRSWQRDSSYVYWYLPVMGAYDFWRDLRLDSIISNTNEKPIDPKDVEVYSDNHGIAAVAIDGLVNQGSVTIAATAEYPYTPKRAKYGPIESEPVTVYWGPAILHLNADFEVDPRSCDVGDTVTFYGLHGGAGAPWTTGGLPPYVKAEWDFDGDGDWDLVVTGNTSAMTLATQQFTFTVAGNYSPILRVTDSSGLQDDCAKPNYIVVGGGAGCEAEPSAAVAFADLIADGKLVIVYNLDPFTAVPTALDGWTWYDPTLPPAQNNMLDLKKTTAYWVKVTQECWLTYGTKSYHLAAGWNNPVWLGC